MCFGGAAEADDSFRTSSYRRGGARIPPSAWRQARSDSSDRAPPSFHGPCTGRPRARASRPSRGPCRRRLTKGGAARRAAANARSAPAIPLPTWRPALPSAIARVRSGRTSARQRVRRRGPRAAPSPRKAAAHRRSWRTAGVVGNRLDQTVGERQGQVVPHAVDA